MSLRDVKAKIRSVDRTRKVTKAMEAVSAVKMRKSQLRALTGRPYARSALAILERLSPSLRSMNHALTRERLISRAAVVVVTSDKGLCGVLNSAVLKEAERTMETLSLPKDSVEIYAFGKKAGEFFDRRGYTVAKKFENVSDDVSLTDLDEVTRELTVRYEKGEFDSVLVIYTNFKSTFEQEAVSHALLPFTLDQFREIVVGITPTRGDTLGAGVTVSHQIPFYTVEPNPEEVLNDLLPRLTSVFLYHMLLEGKASEHSARMVAMKNASDKSRDVSKALNRQYNKVRQAAITREVSEIVGGIEAMAV